jgi:hypothetical protein
MVNNVPNQRILIELASKIRSNSPGKSLNECMTEAIKKLSGGPEVAVIPVSKPSKKNKTAVTSPKAAPRKTRDPIPEHVLQNIARVKEAEEERKRIGMSLPDVTFVLGGKVSPR